MIASGQSPAANIASSRSIIVGSKGVRFSHMSSCPVKPMITYTLASGRGWSRSTPGGR